MRNVVEERVKIAYTDAGFDHRLLFNSWAAGGMDPDRKPRGRDLSEASTTK